MTGANGNALEWALALLQAPEQRHVLKARPLPLGVTELLGIAAGVMPDVLADAKQRFAEPEARICEAARFYAREVLFYPQADAYRVLGVSPDAAAEQIKAHHRVLQAWLHPDRLRSDDDAVFAARVNHAWNQLRTPERRRAYDANLQGAGYVVAPNLQRRKPVWQAQEEGVLPAWRRRWPVLVLLTLCAVLLLLSVYDGLQRPSDHQEYVAHAAAETESGFSALRIKNAQGAEMQQADARQSSMDVITAVREKLGIKPVEPSLRPLDGRTSPVVSQPPVHTVFSENDLNERGAVTSKGETIERASPSPAVPLKPALVEDPPAAPTVDEIAVRSPDLEQVVMAQQAGGQLLNYLQTPKLLSPPIWNSPAVQNRADRLRGEWHASGNVRMQPAQWRIGTETAELTAGYAMRKSASERGRLVATLRWRDGIWLVTDLNLEPLQ